MSPPMISKAAARYTGAGGKEHCSLCRHFSPRRGGRCARVLGDISPRGWCRLFSREIRALIADVPFVAGGGGPVPALSLDFMTPGTLNPAITFTRASTATYFDAAGVMQTAAVNAPRWDYDPATLQLRGLLLEDQRTNMTTNSQTFAGWAVGNATIATGAGTAPDGTNTLSKLAETAITGFHTNRFTATVVASTVYTVSVYAKAAERRYLVLGMDNSGADGFAATFDLQAGVISGAGAAGGAGSYVGSSMQSVGNGIYRCVISGHIGPNTAARLFTSLSLTPTGGSFPSYAGVAGSGIFVWGSQLELGDFATSYIPTTSAAVTRSIDSCTVQPANMAPWFVAPGGSWFAEFRYFDSTPTGGRVIGRTGLGPGAIQMPAAPALTVGQFDGTASMSTANTTGPNTIVRAVTTWAVGQAKAAANGGAVATAANLTTGYPTYATAGITLMTLPSGQACDGHIRAVRYWPTVLTDAQMQAMTA